MADAALDILSWIARGVGLFYLLGGVFAVRMARMELFLDDAIARINLGKSKPEPAERLRVWSMITISVLTVVSGLLLILLLRPAVYAFLANAVVQGVYLVWARKVLPPEDADDALGRRRTTNAFIVWLVMTTLVLLLFEQGRLT